ncbi:uncharacterized protein BKA78DRAFT_357797 [Phyllosticta capitalensis]|uniref:uncharacterized protein n=1 Tax=Phyllosticta capitalensis TaxID=121624 RepID=UPI0031301286
MSSTQLQNTSEIIAPAAKSPILNIESTLARLELNADEVMAAEAAAEAAREEREQRKKQSSRAKLGAFLKKHHPKQVLKNVARKLLEMSRAAIPDQAHRQTPGVKACPQLRFHCTPYPAATTTPALSISPESVSLPDAEGISTFFGTPPTAPPSVPERPAAPINTPVGLGIYQMPVRKPVPKTVVVADDQTLQTLPNPNAVPPSVLPAFGRRAAWESTNP